MSRFLFIRKMLFAVLIVLFFCLPVTQISQAQSGIPEKASSDFDKTIEKLLKEGVISGDGSTTYYGDYTDEWAQIGWYQWLDFENANRFVFSANVTWNSASDKPNNFESGCGVIFNNSGGENHLIASIRMDGFVYFNGYRSNRYLSYGNYRYGKGLINGSADFVLVVDNDKAIVYVDGNRIVRKAELPVMGDNVGLVTLSGTNRDYGTRCIWKDIFFYTW